MSVDAELFAEAHGALKNHAEHRPAAGALLYFALYSERLITRVPP